MAIPQEFSKIVILKDTPSARLAFGPPIDENAILNSSPGSTDPNLNPFYNRLKFGTANFRIGWRHMYPDFDADLAPGAGQTSYPDWTSGVRDNILHAMGVEENSNSGVGYNKTPVSSGTAIIFEDKLFVGDVGGTYDESTTFAIPSPALAEGDYIFWGDDPNSLKIGGKIITVYAPGDTEYDLGARYQFAKNTAVATPVHASGTYSGDPVPQEIYYYRSTWNGKGMKNNLQVNANEVGGGFYVLIKANGTSTNVTYPYLGFNGAKAGDTSENSSEQRIIEAGTLYAFTDLIRIRKISNNFKSDETDTGVSEEIIPCTIHRTSNFYYETTPSGGTTVDYDSATGTVRSLYSAGTAGGFTLWLAYYINPYGGNNFKLDKNTTYVVEVNERLPAVINFVDGQSIYNFAIQGSI